MDLATTSLTSGTRTTGKRRGPLFKRECSKVLKAPTALQESSDTSQWPPLETASQSAAHNSATNEQDKSKDRTSETLAAMEACHAGVYVSGQFRESFCRRSLSCKLGESEDSKSQGSSPVKSLDLDSSVRWRRRLLSNESSPEIFSNLEESRDIETDGTWGRTSCADPLSWEGSKDSGCVSESSRDGFVPIFEPSPENKEPQLPSSFDMLFCSPLHISPLKTALDNLSPSGGSALRRNHDWEGCSSPTLARPVFKSSSKRPGSPSHPLRTQVLKRGLTRKKVISFDEPRCSPKVDCVPRSLSAADIDTALNQADNDPSLIGNFTKKCALPLVEGAPHDLKTITPSTLADLLRGKYESIVDDFTVIDCRYPFEYLGGHVRGAVNIFEPQNLLVAFLEGTCLSPSSRRHVLVFHCEFSSERGPKLARLLRHEDRQLHMDVYPQLRHPEVYLLQGGYKAFHEAFDVLCEPRGYVPMRHKDYESQLSLYRGQAKSISKRRKARYTRPALSRSSSHQEETHH